VKLPAGPGADNSRLRYARPERARLVHAIWRRALRRRTVLAMSLTENAKSLPPPWDRIFSLGTRTFVWGLLLAVLYILSPFLLLIFLTFVFAYIQAHGVDGLAHRIRSRPLRVVIVGLVFLGTLFATGFTLAPQVNEQAVKFWAARETHIAEADRQLDIFLRNWPGVRDSFRKHQRMKTLEELQGANGGKPAAAEDPNREFTRLLRDLVTVLEALRAGKPLPRHEGEGQGEKGEATPPGAGHEDKEGERPVDGAGAAPRQGEPGEQAKQDEPKAPAGTDPGQPITTANEPAVEPQQPTPDPAETAPNEPLRLVSDLFDKGLQILEDNPLAIGQSVLGYASAFLLALLFSFLIVLDLPKIKRGIGGLAETKVGFIYSEVADNIADFGRVLGRALEAQLFIAIVNTILTAIGMWMLGLDNILVLSTIVFFCSFIPVAGTFLSSTPICLVALQTPGGVTTMLLAIVLICIIHAIETYVLNPQIYGHHMHMNPVVVLIVLTVGGKLFGVWGLLLGIPVVNYFWRHAIRQPEERPADT
jgi:predicted PurR-regulated permease PerM